MTPGSGRQRCLATKGPNKREHHFGVLAFQLIKLYPFFFSILLCAQQFYIFSLNILFKLTYECPTNGRQEKGGNAAGCVFVILCFFKATFIIPGDNSLSFHIQASVTNQEQWEEMLATKGLTGKIFISKRAVVLIKMNAPRELL